jgi:hypothetical protein
MRKLLAIISLGLLFSGNADAGTYKDRKYTFESLYKLGPLIKKGDPTDFKELKFIRKSEGNEFLSTSGKPNRGNLSGKRKIYLYDAYVFHAIYNSGHKINVFVDTDYAKNSEKAEKEALRYAKIIGQIPLFLREGSPNLFNVVREKSKGIRKIIIAKGNNRWWADRILNQFFIYPQGIGTGKDLIVMHEAAHLSIDTKLVLDDVWIQAIIDDQRNITKYAIQSFNEDVAETIPFWVAVRCTNRSKGVKNKITKSIPNRIKALDKFIKKNNLSTSPMNCTKD